MRLMVCLLMRERVLFIPPKFRSLSDVRVCVSVC
jgi:hypothetical protein